MPRAKQYPRVKKPKGKILREARMMLAKRNELKHAKPFEKREVHEIRAEVDLYKHAMNLSEELFKHYSTMHPKTPEGKKTIERAIKLAESDFKEFSLRHEVMQDYLKSKIKRR